MLNLPYKLVLGSQSPRRRSLLKRLNLPFETRLMPDIDESYPADITRQSSSFLGRGKRLVAIFLHLLGRLLITADMVVLLGEKLLEDKPLLERRLLQCLEATLQEIGIVL